MLRGINTVITPPIVSIPNDNGVTSSNNTSFTSPEITPPWIAAPIATASSGLIPVIIFPLNFFSTSSFTAGILLEPPISSTLSISFSFSFAAFKASSIFSVVLVTKSLVN